MSLGATDTSFTYDNLFAGDYPKVTSQITVPSGAGALARGTVLGKITSSGKGVIVNSGGTDDGSRAPYAILAVDVDASNADVVAPIYLSGDFNENKLVFGGTDTADTHRAALRDANIYLHKAVAA